MQLLLKIGHYLSTKQRRRFKRQAQPVNQTISYALSCQYLRGRDLNTAANTLRQQSGQQAPLTTSAA